MALRGVILDVDGTLVLSNEAHAQAWVDAFQEFGYDVDVARVRPLIGMGGDKLLPAVVPELSEERGPGQEIAERRKAIFRERYAAELEPTPGSRELLQHLRAQGLATIIASSASRDELDLLLAAARVADLVEAATTSSDAEESKPAPDIVGVALDRLQLSPDEVLMIGDTPYDIAAARGCGVGVIAVRSGGHDDESLAGALAIYADPAELLVYFPDSPLADPA